MLPPPAREAGAESLSAVAAPTPAHERDHALDSTKAGASYLFVVGRIGLMRVRGELRAIGGVVRYHGPFGSDHERFSATQYRYVVPTRLELDEILALARRAHGDQRDPDGSLHIDHVERVAGTVEGERARAVALLHEVLEDTAETAAGLLEEGVEPDVVQAVELLTRSDHGDYATYIDRILGAEGTTGELARTVKLADARDNLSRSERQGDHARTSKHQCVVDLLTGP